MSNRMYTGDLLDGTKRGKNRRWIASIVSEEDIRTVVRLMNETRSKENRISLAKLDLDGIVVTYRKLLNDNASALLDQVIQEVA
jgi:hypothetical protein